MTKYIFLDFDGVLNTENYQRQLKQSGCATTDRYGALFDPLSVKNLRTIIEKTDAKVCVTSSWAIEIGKHNLTKFWKERNMPGELAGTTAGVPINLDVFFNNSDDEEFDPYVLLESGVGARGSEIKAFLKQKKSTESKYVILDDTADFCKDQQKNFIHINPKTGITEDDVRKAVTILSDSRF